MKNRVLLVLISLVSAIIFANNKELTTVHAATTTITVKKNDETTAKKIDKQLKKGKAVQLKVKGNKSSSKKLLQKIRNQVGEVNNCDVKFQYVASGSSGKYYIYSVSGENAKLYKYSVQFVEKLYKKTRKKIVDAYKNVLADEKRYSDEKERKTRIVYDNLVLWILAAVGDVDYERMFECGGDDDYHPDIEWRDDPNAKIIGYDVTETSTRLASLAGDLALSSNYHVLLKNVDESFDLEEMEFELLELRSYAEFVEYIESNSGLDSFIEKFEFPQISQQNRIIINNAKFSSLSDAMKIYAVGESNYFNGSTVTSFGVTYTFHEKSPTPTSGSKGMKHLLKGTGRGVCHQFARYECLLWEQLEITSYYNSYSGWNHAWSVVKVKNSKGKTMWIPFDYGVNTYVSKKDYKIYMKGIKGAPSKQKWKEKDFN